MDQNSINERWIEMCEREVREFTGIKFEVVDDKGRPSLNFSFEKKTWTHKRLVQIFHVCNMIEPSGIPLHLLVELYNDDPIHMYRQVRKLMDMRGGKSRNNKSNSLDQRARNLIEDLSLSLNLELELPQFKHFVVGLLPIREEMEPIFKRLMIETVAIVQYRRSQSRVFKSFVDKNWRPKEFKARTGGETPLITGMHRIFSDQLRRFETDLVTYVNEWSHLSRDALLTQFLVSPQNQEGIFDKKPFQFIFSPSGSGKTTSILHELKRCYGYYMVSGALRDTAFKERIQGPSATDKNILNPKALRGCSRDTSMLFTMLNWIRPLAAATMPNDVRFRCIKWWQHIFETRHKVYRCFLDALDSRSTPELWLSFQLDCNEWDPFLQIFQVLSLFKHSTFKDARTRQVHVKTVQWVCIDEAQEDLRIELSDLSGAQSFNLFASSLWSASINIQNSHPYFQQAIYAGTSLNVQKAQQSHNDVYPFVGAFLDPSTILRYSRTAANSDIEKIRNIVTKFPLVLNRNSAREVLKAYGLEGSESALDETGFLRGRVKWTAMYADRIIDELSGGMPTTYEERKVLFAAKQHDMKFRALAEDTYANIIADLAVKLDDFQKRKEGTELLHKLLEAAISMDILGRPHVFYQEREMQLVEEGFAVMDTSIAQLDAELARNFITIEKAGNYLTAKSKVDSDIDELTVGLLARVQTTRFTIVGCTTNELTDKMLHDGFTIVDCTLEALATELEEEGFAIIDKSRDKVTAKLRVVPMVTLTDKSTAELLANPRVRKLARLMNSSVAIDGYTTHQLTEDMLRAGFTIWGDYVRPELGEWLKRNSFTISAPTKHHLTATLLQTQQPSLKLIKAVKSKVMQEGVHIVDGKIQKIAELIDNDFTIRWDDTNIFLKLKRYLEDKNLTVNAKAKTQLEAVLSKPFTYDVALIEKWIRGKGQGHIKIINKRVSELKNLVKGPFTVIDRNQTTNEITRNMMEDGFIIWGDHERVSIEDIPEIMSFDIKQETNVRKFAQLKKGCKIDGRKLASKLTGKGFYLAGNAGNQLVATLAERVVIDAVIQFSIGHRLDEQLMSAIRFASARTGLGHLAENYLAVQLLQYLRKYSTNESCNGDDIHTTKWASKRSRILAALADANDSGNKKIGTLEKFSLITGHQTVSKYNDWRGWMDGYLGWLSAIEGNRKPCASFLMPHNDFGPDLIFALRHVEDESKIVLCSVQLKLGSGNPDAVNKSSLSWACWSKKTEIRQGIREIEDLESEQQELTKVKEKTVKEKSTLEKMGLYKTYLEMAGKREEKLKESIAYLTRGRKVTDQNSGLIEEIDELLENTFWKDQMRLSLLVVIGEQVSDQMKIERPNTSHRKGCPEYYTLIFGEAAEDLFGGKFMAVLSVV